MSSITKEFIEWMDTHSISARRAAELLHAEEQTIRNWRSKGVPPRRHNQVICLIKDWDKGNTSVTDTLTIHPLHLQPTVDQFRLFSAAAALAGTNVLDWSIQELEEAAREALDIPTITKSNTSSKLKPDMYEAEHTPTSMSHATSVKPLANGKGAA